MNYKMLEERILEDTKRRSQKQKDNFINLLINNGYELKIEKQGNDKNPFSIVSKNMIFGDINKAKYIITAHYDTPKKTIFENRIKAYKKKIPAITPLILALIIYFVVAKMIKIKSNIDYTWIGIIAIVAVTIVYFCDFLYSKKANITNVNDNTSGVISALRLFSRLKNSDNVAFVLFDNEEKGLIGSKCFLKKHKEQLKNKIMVNLDCVGDGDIFMIGYNNPKLLDGLKYAYARSMNIKPDVVFKFEEARKLNGNSDHKTFKKFNTVNIGAYGADEKSRITTSKIHTDRDRFGEGCIDKEDYFANINLITEMLINYVNGPEIEL